MLLNLNTKVDESEIMKDDNKPPVIIISTPDSHESFFYKLWVEEQAAMPGAMWAGVDWAKDSGMNRGDVIKRDGNVTTVRFKTVTLRPVII